jgi:hypothetical protein
MKTKMKTAMLVLGVFFSISVAAYGGDNRGSEENANATVPDSGTVTATPQHPQGERPPKAAPLQPYPRLLPLQLIAPPTAQAGMPFVGISVSLLNPGDEAPNARLRLIIHDNDHRDARNQRVLSPDNVKVEVQEGRTWKPVHLGMVEAGVLGAIGTEGLTAHRERHQRGGFAIPAGLNKTWQLRVTFNLPGTYSLVAAVSPDNGSRHLAQPAHTIIVVQ